MVGIDLGLMALATRRRAASFHPASLHPFGVFDASDPATLFQDSAGKTPVTSAGDPVGLMLDTSQKLSRGAELVTGDFLTGWVGANGPLTLTDGVYRIESDVAAEAQARFAVSGLEVGAYYIATWDTIDQQGGSAYHMIGFSIGDGGGRGGFSGSGTTQVVLRATATSGEFRLGTNSGSAGDFVEFTAPSLRRLPGHHVYQSAASARPVYQTNGSHSYIAGDGTNRFLNLPDLPVPATHSVCIAANIKGVGGSNDALVSLDSANANYQLDAGVGGGFRGRINGSNLGAAEIEGNADLIGPHVFTLSFDAIAQTATLRVDGAEVWQASGYNGALDPQQTLRLLAGRGGEALNADLYAGCFWGGANPTDIAKVEGWAATKIGTAI
ncbi:hypothetical protein [Aliiroseovarius sp. YM-037]|uniref:hypothetical protein n=1 Tax=Aliiroseovarius sp. YM-037 TaxID=3341728 RepID=UPI003A8136F4